MAKKKSEMEIEFDYWNKSTISDIELNKKGEVVRVFNTRPMKIAKNVPKIVN